MKVTKTENTTTIEWANQSGNNLVLTIEIVKAYDLSHRRTRSEASLKSNMQVDGKPVAGFVQDINKIIPGAAKWGDFVIKPEVYQAYESAVDELFEKTETMNGDQYGAVEHSIELEAFEKQMAEGEL